MKKLLLSMALIAGVAWMMQAQISTPSLSPGAKYTQKVGLVDVTVEYSRPSVRGRKIMGDLVPFNTIWRTGANAATKFSFSDDVKVGGQELKKGSYAVLTKPGEKEWKVMFYAFEQPGFNSYVEKEPTASFMVNSQKLPMTIESFTIGIGNLSATGAQVWVMWENTMVGFPIEVNTHKAVEANIKQVMAGPSQNDYYAAASYYEQNDKNLETALKYVNKAIDMGYKRYWTVGTKSNILSKLGKKAEAISAAKMSAKLASEAGNQGWVKTMEKNIMAWSKM